MYRCAITKRMSRSGEKLNRLVVETRPKAYFGWVYNEEFDKWDWVQVGSGFETVKEINVSEAGLKIWNEAHKNDGEVNVNG